jgi:hypothetical protein
MKKFKVGDYVKIPKTKSIESRLHDSGVVAEAKAKNQDYLIVTIVNDDYYVLDLKLTGSGDYFLEEDLEFYSTGHLGMITVSKENLKKIHDIACGSWQAKIIEYASSNPFGNYVELTSNEVDVMFTAATTDQLPVLEEIFGKRQEELDFRNKSVAGKIDGIKIFGESYLTPNTAFIKLSSYERNKFCLNSNYNWELKGNELFVTRK